MVKAAFGMVVSCIEARPIDVRSDCLNTYSVTTVRRLIGTKIDCRLASADAEDERDDDGGRFLGDVGARAPRARVVCYERAPHLQEEEH